MSVSAGNAGKTTYLAAEWSADGSCVKWEKSENGINVRAVDNGSCDITAKYNGQEYKCRVNVSLAGETRTIEVSYPQYYYSEYYGSAINIIDYTEELGENPDFSWSTSSGGASMPDSNNLSGTRIIFTSDGSKTITCKAGNYTFIFNMTAVAIDMNDPGEYTIKTTWYSVKENKVGYGSQDAIEWE